MMTACQSFTDFSERLLSRRCLFLLKVHGNVNKVQATMYKKSDKKKSTENGGSWVKRHRKTNPVW